MPEATLGTGVAVAVLCAALMHAGWNALIRGAPDKALFTVLLHLCSGLLAAVGLCFTGWPRVESLPYLAASALLHSAYVALLMRTYEGGQLAVGYVLMRGLAPLLVGLVSMLVLQDPVSPQSWGGIVCILAGVLLIASTSGQPLGRLPRQRAGQAALLNAGVIAAYTLVDGQGARASGNPLAYVLALALLEPLAVLTLQLRNRPREFLDYARQHWALGLLGAVVATSAYAVVLWAMTRAPIAVVAALRETSIVFAVLIGRLWFKEGRLAVGAAAAVLVLVGVALLRA